MNDEYIKREAVIKGFTDLLQKPGDIYPTDITTMMQRIPAEEVRPVVWGKWIPDYDYAEYDYDGSTPLAEPRKFQDGWKCSLCGGYMPSETNFCPNCGADMRGEDDV